MQNAIRWLQKAQIFIYYRNFPLLKNSLNFYISGKKSTLSSILWLLGNDTGQDGSQTPVVRHIKISRDTKMSRDIKSNRDIWERDIQSLKRLVLLCSVWPVQAAAPGAAVRYQSVATTASNLSNIIFVAESLENSNRNHQCNEESSL